MGQLFGPEANPLLRIGRRRWILQAGLTGAAGLSLPLLLQAKAQGGLAENKKRATSVIQISRTVNIRHHAVRQRDERRHSGAIRAFEFCGH